MAPEERAKYWESRADRLEALAMKLNGERDALAARNAELHDVAGILLCIDQCETCREDGEFNRDAVKRVINREAPASLAQRDARIKAEALEEIAGRLWPVGMIGKGDERDALLLRASEYRQQAEGIE